MVKSRPCERCGAVIECDDYMWDNKQIYEPMCAETQIAYGIVAWLCFDCRKAWHHEMKDQLLSKQYSEASLRLEFWKAKVMASGVGDVDEGLQLWRNLDALEVKLNNYANEWLLSDPDRNSPNSNDSYADGDA